MRQGGQTTFFAYVAFWIKLSVRMQKKKARFKHKNSAKNGRSGNPGCVQPESAAVL
jgi:hypothetical protein